MELTHSQKQQQQLALSQEMLTSLNVLELSGTELMDFVLEESQSNPAMDSDAALDQSEKLCDSMEFVRVSALARSSAPTEQDEDEPRFEESVPMENTLSDHLMWQLQALHLDSNLCMIARWIINNLDEDGYLREGSYPSAISETSFETALDIVQSLDPPGVGARTLQENMILQLRRKELSNETLEKIIQFDLEALAAWKFPYINKKYGTEESEQFLKLIQELNPRPSAGFSSGAPVHYVIPEVTYQIIKKGSNRFIETQLNNEMVPKITVSQRYLDLIKHADPETEPTLQLYIQRLNSIIESIEKRNDTLIRVSQAIAKNQEKMILGDTSSPEPLTMQSVADELDLNVSTISRCVRGKFVRLQDRIVPMKDFFETGVSGNSAQGTDLGQSQIMEVLKQLIENEDKKKPLSDAKLTARLNEKGIEIKRRTVAKYRDLLGFETASARKRKAEFKS